MSSLIVSIYDYLKRHRAQRGISLLMTTICLVGLVMHQTYKEDISDFLPLDNKYEQALDLYQGFSGTDRIITIFQFRDSTDMDPDAMTLAISDFNDCLQENDSTGVIQDLTTQVDAETFTHLVSFVYTNIPYFLTDADYDRIDSLLADRSYIQSQIAVDKQMLLFPVSGLLSENFRIDPLNLFTPTVTRLQHTQPSVKYELYDGYIFSPDMSRAFAMMRSPFGPSETENNARLLCALQSVAGKVMTEHPQISVRFAGGPVIAVGNASQIKNDSLLSVALAIILISGLLLWVFRDVRNLLLIVLSIAWGWLFAMGLLSVFHNNVSVIVIGISSVILGIAVNYPLHLIAHQRHTPDMKTTLKEIVMPLVVGNITTVGAFLALVPLKSLALRDLGAFAAFLLIGTILFVLIYLPHLTTNTQSQHRGKSFLDKISDFSLEKHSWIVALVLILTVVFGYFSMNTSFDSNMSHINYMTEQQRQDMAYFQQFNPSSSTEQSVFVVLTDSTLEDALSRSASLQPLVQDLSRKSLITGFNSPTSYVCSLEEQRHRLHRWKELISRHAQRIEHDVKAAASSLGFSPDSFEPFYQLLHGDFDEQDLSYFYPIISTVGSTQLLLDSIDNTHHVVNILSVSNENVDRVEELLEQRVPGSLVFDVQGMNSSIATNLSDDFNYIGWACAVIVFLFLWFSLGSIELALLSFLPMAISWIWILGIMAILGIKFNVVNVILATFIFGQGDDYTIFMTEGCQYEYAYGKRMLSSYKNSIIISALIMFIGIGALIFAKHPALHSLAEVTIVGMFSVVLMAYLFPPLIFKWLIAYKDNRRKRPITLKTLLVTVYCGIVFFLQLVSVYVLGFLLFEVMRPTEARRNTFRRYIRKCFWLDMNHVPTVKFNLKNPDNEDFSTAAVVICNHQSMLDTAYLMAITDRIIIVANRKAGNNLIIRKVFKWMDFYAIPSDDTVDNQHLASALKKGYCVAIFPEGERNDDTSIKRFHKGAFKLAEMCQVDILPLFIHGANHVFPRYTVCTYPGEVTLEIGRRIRYDDDSWGKTFVERTRMTHELYVNRFSELRHNRENAAFFKGFVTDTYRYRGVEIAAAVRKRLVRYSNYSSWTDLDDTTTDVVIINSGWGEFPLMMTLVNPHVTVHALEGNEDMLTVAAQAIKPISDKVHLLPNNVADITQLPQPSSRARKVFLLNPDAQDIESYSQLNPIIID